VLLRAAPSSHGDDTIQLFTLIAQSNQAHDDLTIAREPPTRFER
jgi:hypothetical protein